MTHLGARFGLGLIILLVGALMLVELFADIQLPIFRLVVGIVILRIGGRMIAQTWARRGRDETTGEAVLAELTFSQRALDRDARFDVVLGRGTIDLTKLVEPTHDVTVTVEALFGQAVVRLPPAIAYDVEGSAAFGQVRMPDRSATAMGSLEYRPPSDHPSRLHLRVHAVFGACQVIEAAAASAAA